MGYTILMKKSFKFLLLCSLLAVISSCKKKEYTCGHSIFYQPVSIVFKGFSAADLKKVIVKTYVADSQFDQPLSTDTFDYSHADFRGDTAYIYVAPFDESTGFYDIEVGKDYTFAVLTTNDVYSIKNVMEGKKSDTWTQDHECSMGAGQAEIEPLLLDVNNKSASPFYWNTNRYLVCLSH